MEDLEFATLEWVDWFNNRRLLSVIGYMPPAEYEQAQRTAHEEHCYSSPVLALAGTQPNGLHETRGSSVLWSRFHTRTIGMSSQLASRLLQRVSDVSNDYYRLVLLVGPARSGKTQALADLGSSRGWPRINVNLALSERLLELTKKQRSVRMIQVLDEIIGATGSEIVLLDNIEILFAVELAQDPLRLLQGLSRSRTLVTAWPGEFRAQTLTYAEREHREFRKYSMPEVVVVSAPDSTLASELHIPEGETV